MEKSRQPIVTVLGHVDHGKTTLLDSIRETNIATREIGGITQSIGASVVATGDGKKITFIDTPGHAAFSQMRSRGANVADIAILVVAADDGVKPQTKEALEYIRKAGIPFIVAATKIDLPSASVATVKGQLEKEGVALEGKGGDTPIVSVSAKTHKGINELLEMISLVSELREIKADPDADLEAVVIETRKDKKGPLASVVVRNGSLKVGNDVVSEGYQTRIRGIFDSSGKSVKEVYPGDPAMVLGFEKFPAVGAKITSAGGKKEGASEKVEKKAFDKAKLKADETPIVVKASSTGALETILSNLPEKIMVISSGIGDVNESDIFTAKAGSSIKLQEPARIIVFESKVPSTVAKLAETEGIEIKPFKIIYELFQELENINKRKEIHILGKANILAAFPFENERVAGCKVVEGRIEKGDNINLERNGKKIGEAKIRSMKKEKKDITIAKMGEEFGVIFTPQVDFNIGDVVLSVRK